MTDIDFITVQCPNCNTPQEILIWKSLNVTLSPEGKEDLFSGKINVLNCKKCGFISTILHPLLYNDMQRHFCVYYFPESFVDDDRFLEGWFTKEGKLKIINVPELGYMADPHIVFNIVELLSYVHFKDRLYDMLP